MGASESHGHQFAKARRSAKRVPQAKFQLNDAPSSPSRVKRGVLGGECGFAGSTLTTTTHAAKLLEMLADS